VGAPSGAPAQVGSVSRRPFAKRARRRQPTASATVTVPLGGQYVQPNGALVTSLLLGPHSGAVLRTP